MSITRLFAVTLVVAAMTWAAPLKAAEFKIDKTHTFVQFKVIHLGFSWLNGRFDDFSGNFSFNPEAGPNAQKISFTIQTDSINTNHAERDKHLRSAEFLDTKKYPTATFKSTGFDGAEDGGILTGNLTLHGVTKSIEIEVSKIGDGKDPWGGFRAGFEGVTEINRSDFGMKYDLGPEADIVYLELYVEGIRQ